MNEGENLGKAQRQYYREANWRDKADLKQFDCKHENLQEVPGRRYRICADCDFYIDDGGGKATQPLPESVNGEVVNPVPGSLKAAGSQQIGSDSKK